MELAQHKGKITLGTVTGVIGCFILTWNWFDPWPSMGWTTPNQHAADFAATEQAIESFAIEWRCSEWAEELHDLYARQAAGNDSQQMEDKINGLREKMDESDCDRWEDY